MPSSPKFVNRKFKLPAQSPHCRMACGCFAEQNMNCRRFPTNSATPKFFKTSPARPRFHPAADFIFFLRNNCMLSDTSQTQCGKFATTLDKLLI